MANIGDADIVAKITLSESFVIDLKIQIYDELLKVFFENSYHNSEGDLKFNADEITSCLSKLIDKLKSEKITKAPITKPASAESISGISL